MNTDKPFLEQALEDARKATGGEWFIKTGNVNDQPYPQHILSKGVDHGDDTTYLTQVCDLFDGTTDTATHIANMSPAKIQPLLEAVKAVCEIELTSERMNGHKTCVYCGVIVSPTVSHYGHADDCKLAALRKAAGYLDTKDEQ